MLTRHNMVIISQYIQISNHYVVHLKLMSIILHFNYNLIFFLILLSPDQQISQAETNTEPLYRETSKN